MGIGHHARMSPRATALAAPGTSLTFAELDDRQRAVVGLLQQGGVERGERIAVLASNRLEYLEVTMGCLRGGIVPVPIHASLTPREAQYILDDSGARWLFTDRVAESIPGLERVVIFGDAYERRLSAAPRADLEEVTLTRPMHYTSGTTGRPKGVWVAPKAPDVAEQNSTDFRRLWALNESDVHLVCSPLSHSAPHRYCVRTLEAGASVFVPARFDAEETLASIDLIGVTSTFMVPTHLERIVALEDQVRLYDLSSMRLLCHAGAPVRPETKRRVLELFPEDSVWEFYGATEGQATRISAHEWRTRPGSVGRALPGVAVAVTDTDGKPVAAGEVGEVWISGASVERFEYWGDTQATRGAWRKDAFTVGDLGYVDEKGFLFLSGRKHGTIISGGVNVYPQEVELALCAHPMVAEALVYGVPHAEWGQEVRALVVPRSEDIDLEELRRRLRKRLAGYKCPRHIEIVQELPRTPTGKLIRQPPEPY